uniref:ABC-2 type transporter transmembrane domain-containing protein n=1 Tax=Ananas comosus var. bracteatus TaxID=296719 RepID=A0A6V7NTY5_ANACO|nr:unnamed protein product [Ananas comosus var. bracteatus]
MSTTFYTCADALPVFLHERNVFMRETAYNAYRRSSYVLANALVSFPPLLLLAGPSPPSPSRPWGSAAAPPGSGTTSRRRWPPSGPGAGGRRYSRGRRWGSCRGKLREGAGGDRGGAGVAIADDTCLTTGADVLRQQAVTQLGKWQALAVTVAGLLLQAPLLRRLAPGEQEQEEVIR